MTLGAGTATDYRDWVGEWAANSGRRVKVTIRPAWPGVLGVGIGVKLVEGQRIADEDLASLQRRLLLNAPMGAEVRVVHVFPEEVWPGERSYIVGMDLSISGYIAAIESEGGEAVVTMTLPANAWKLLKQLCEVQAQAAGAVGYADANDCLCGNGGNYWSVHRVGGEILVTRASRFQSSGSAVAFVERAVSREVERAARRPAKVSEVSDVREWAAWGVSRVRQWVADRLMGMSR